MSDPSPSKWCVCREPEPKHQTDAIDVCKKCIGMTSLRIHTFADLAEAQKFIKTIE